MIRDVSAVGAARARRVPPRRVRNAPLIAMADPSPTNEPLKRLDDCRRSRRGESKLPARPDEPDCSRERSRWPLIAGIALVPRGGNDVLEKVGGPPEVEDPRKHDRSLDIITPPPLHRIIGQPQPHDVAQTQYDANEASPNRPTNDLRLLLAGVHPFSDGPNLKSNDLLEDGGNVVRTPKKAYTPRDPTIHGWPDHQLFACEPPSHPR